MLLLDDEPEIVYVAGEYLSALGWQTTRCSSMAEAYRAVADLPAFDAAVLDWVVGGSSVRGLLAKLRTRHPGCQVLLATGLGREIVDEDELGLPVIRKPYTMRDLAALLDEQVRNRPR